MGSGCCHKRTSTIQTGTGSEARKEMRVGREAAGTLGGKNWWRDRKEFSPNLPRLIRITICAFMLA